MSGWSRPPLPPESCPYCGGETRLHPDSSAFYRGQDYGPVWACVGCGAYVGCHPGTTRPLGRVADAELRRMKMAAHDAFDRLWRRKMQRDQCGKQKARGLAYKWLAGELGIPAKHCHIGYFDSAMCARVVEACAPFLRGGCA